jgi:hypothetical protein
MATLSGASGSYNAAVQTSRHGNTWTTSQTIDAGSPAGMDGTNTIATPGGSVTVSYGGVNTYAANGSEAGVTGVTKLGLTVTSSTDSNIAPGNSGKVESFAGVVGLQYADFGTWSLKPCAGSGNCDAIYVGTYGGAQTGQSLTATSAIPTSGYASYWGGATGAVAQPSTVNPNNVGLFYGTFGLTANFSNGTLTGAITNIQVYSTGGGTGSQTNYGTLNDIAITNPISGNAIRGNSYSARVTAGGTDSSGQTPTGFDISGASGKLIGGFYGPAAQETSGTFYLAGGANGTQLVGSFGASAGSDTGNVTEIANHLVSLDRVSGTQGNNLVVSPETPGSAIIQKTLDTSPDGFTKIATYLTNGGAIVVEEGGAQTYSANRAILGLPSTAGVEGGNLIILASTDPAVTTGGGGNWDSFGKAAGLQYSDFGFWTLSPTSNTASSQNPVYVGASAGAKPGGTETARMPSTGTATFTGSAAGYVAVANTSGEFYAPTTLNANFATNVVTGTIGSTTSGITVYAVDGGSRNTVSGTMNAIGISAAIGGTSNTAAEYSGTVTALSTSSATISISGASGPIKGAFYGPAAQETAGTFQLSGVGAQVIGSFGLKTATPSDRRLKVEIAHAGHLANGLALYSWRYLGGRHRFTGVMAQDLLADRRFADAVKVDGDGVMRVDYARIGYTPHNRVAMAAEGEVAVGIYRAMLH